MRLTGGKHRIFIPDMLKHLSLPLLAIAATLIVGCAENQAGHGASYQNCNGSVAQPVYYCAGVQYYSIGGRYCYFTHRQTHYITSLPSGGHYYHNHHAGSGGSATYYESDQYSGGSHRNSGYSAPLHSTPAPKTTTAVETVSQSDPTCRYVPPSNTAPAAVEKHYPQGD